MVMEGKLLLGAPQTPSLVGWSSNDGVVLMKAGCGTKKGYEASNDSRPRGGFLCIASSSSKSIQGGARVEGRTYGNPSCTKLRRPRILIARAENEKKPDVGPTVNDSEKAFFVTPEFWLKVAVVVMTIGFVDAGYSGDWSRIGALSKESEAQLRVAAFGVVPLSAALVWVIGKNRVST